MFKKIAIFTVALMCFLIPVSRGREVVVAASVLNQNTEYNNEVFTINETVSGDYFTVPNGVTLTLNDVTISGSGSVGSVIKVEAGGKLVVNNLNVTLSNCTYAISNYGECIIDGLTVTSTNTYDIYNSSNKCTFENVSIDRLYLNDGYITVNGYTEIENTISVELSSTKENIPSLIVDGDGVFASRFNDKFNYIGDYQVEYRPNPMVDPQIYDTTFDYVGSTEKMTDTAKSTVAGLGLTTGDIILSSKSCMDKTSNYLVPVYATMNSYLETATSGTYEFSNGYIYDTNSDDGINPIVADNYHMVIHSNKTATTVTSNSAKVTLETRAKFNGEQVSLDTYNLGIKGSWLVFVDRQATDYTIEKSDNINITELYNCDTHIALLVEHTGEEVYSTAASINVLFTKITEVKVMPTLVSNDFTYTGEDLFEDIEVVYYFSDAQYSVGVVPIEIIDAGTYTLYLYSKDAGFELERRTIDIVVKPKELTIEYTQTSNEYTGNDIVVTAVPRGVVGGDTVKVSLTDNVKKEIGSYTVSATIDNDNYVIADGYAEYAFNISKIKIEESWEKPADIGIDYVGHIVLPDIGAIETAHSNLLVEYEYEEPPINAGEYTVYVNVSLKDAVHYAALSSEKSRFECVVNINKKSVMPYFAVSTFEYTGEVPVLDLYFTGAVNGETVTGGYNEFAGYTVGSYDIECYLAGNAVNSNYILYRESSILSIAITPATINMSNVAFVDEEIEYTGVVYIPQVANLPSAVAVTYEYEGEVYTKGTHTVTARFTRIDAINYAPLSVTELSMTLTIVEARIDVSGVTLVGAQVDYDGAEHGLTLSNMPNNVTYSVDKNDYIDAGTYTITFTLQPISANYVLYGRDSMNLSATLVINKIDYDLSTIAFVDKSVIYNAEPHTITMTGTLPVGLTTQNTVYFTNVGEHTVWLVFINASANYNTPESISATLTINPKTLTVSLVEDEFTYTGEEFTVEATVDGEEGDDTVVVTLTGNKNTLAGNYTAVASITDSNYILDAVNLPYTIKKAIIDMSGISLQNKELYYSGSAYIPQITGVLPTGITNVIYTHEEIKNVGQYDVVAAFEVDANYHTPVQLFAIIEIVPKHITISFSNHLNLMYNGETQYITVTVTGMVDNEEYTISYSDEPKEPGEYCCEVILSATTNYTPMSDTRCYFDIHTATKSYTGEKYNLTVSNGMFKADNELSVNKITLSKEVESQVKTMHQEMVYMDSIKIIADHSETEISVSLELKELNLAKNKAITLYRLTNDGKLVKVEYSVEGNNIKFSSLPNTNYIIVSDEVDNSIMILLIIVAGLFVVVSAFSVVMVIKNKKLKKSKETK